MPVSNMQAALPEYCVWRENSSLPTMRQCALYAILCKITASFITYMDRQSQPTKEQVRQWLLQRQERREPLPTADEIRRQLGWAPLRFQMINVRRQLP